MSQTSVVGWMGRGIAAAIAALALFSAPPARAADDALLPSELASVSRSMLIGTVQGRLDYLGPQAGTLWPLVFATDGRAADPALMDGLPEGVRAPVLDVSEEEMRRFLLDAAALLGGDGVQDPWLTVTLALGEAAGRRRLVRRLSREEAAPFYAAFWRAFRSRPASVHVQAWGCALGLLPDGRPAEVTDSTEISVGRFEADGSGRYSGRVTVRNRSSASLPAPVSVVFELSDNIRLLEPDGTTCHVEPVGRDYVHLPLSESGLAPGEEASVTLAYANSERQPVSMSLKLVAGPEPR